MPDLIDELLAKTGTSTEKKKKPKDQPKQGDLIDDLLSKTSGEGVGVLDAINKRFSKKGILTENFPESGVAKFAQGFFNAMDATASAIASVLPTKNGAPDLTLAEAIANDLRLSQTALGYDAKDFEDTDVTHTARIPSMGMLPVDLRMKTTAEQKAGSANLAVDVAYNPSTYVGASGVNFKLLQNANKVKSLKKAKVADNIETKPLRNGDQIKPDASKVVQPPETPKPDIKTLQSQLKDLKQKAEKAKNELVEMPDGEVVQMSKKVDKPKPSETKKVFDDAASGTVPSEKGVAKLDKINARRVKERIEARKQVNSDHIPLDKKPIVGSAADLTGVPTEKVGKSTLRQYTPEEQEIIKIVKAKFADDVDEAKRGVRSMDTVFKEAKQIQPEIAKLLDEGLPKGTVLNDAEMTAAASVVRSRFANLFLDLLSNNQPKALISTEAAKSELGRALNSLKFRMDDPQAVKASKMFLEDVKNGDYNKIMARALDELPDYRNAVAKQKENLDKIKAELLSIKKERPC